MNTVPFLEHLEELRSTLLRCLCIVAVGCLLAFLFYRPIIEWFTAPLQGSLVEEARETSRVVNRSSKIMEYQLSPGTTVLAIEGAKETRPGSYSLSPGSSLEFSRFKSRPLVVLGPLEGMAIALKTALWVGIALTAPLWGLFVARFVAPGLRTSEKRMGGLFVIASAVFMALGALFAYSVTIPLANVYLTQFNAVIGENWWTLSHYLDYTLFLLVANATAFEFGVIGLFAVHYGMVTAEFLVHYRRHAILLAFILGAILTPPDIVTQLMLAIPLIGLYELVIFYARLRTRLAHVN